MRNLSIRNEKLVDKDISSFTNKKLVNEKLVNKKVMNEDISPFTNKK